jgi:antitoxin (DNA-binding transcriptional repressor) of toxin-antitoxin stability system
MALQVNIHEAKTHLSRLLERVRCGEDVVIARAGRPIACLTRLPQEPTERRPGSARGQIEIAPDFDAPLPDDVLQDFES